eukprot:Mrub_01068.p1 GENE.Mrub_01068~~Mrub_01068.p1  ORF type:complete len:760 (+),score=136.67 Mrub_01068:47-2326(+)
MYRHKLNVKTYVPNYNSPFDSIPLYDQYNNSEKPLHRDDFGYILAEVDGKISFSWNNYHQLNKLIMQYGPFMNDYHIAFCAYKAWMVNLPFDSLAETVLLKFIMDKLPNFNYENGSSLAMIVMGMSGLGCTDPKFWKLVEEKLIDEEIYRYIPLNYSLNFLHVMAMADIKSEKIFGTYEKYIIKHRNQLDQQGRNLLYDVFIDRENCSNVDILAPLLSRDIASQKIMDQLKEETRARKRSKLDKLGNLMKNVKSKEDWALTLEKRLDVFKQSLNVWEPGESLKPEIDTRYDVLIQKMFSANQINLDDVKADQEGFLNSFMILCNYVQINSNDETNEQESIIEAISVVMDLCKEYKVKDGKDLRQFIVTTYSNYVMKYLKDDYNLNSYHGVYGITEEDWNKIYSFVVKSEKTMQIEGKKAEILLLNSISTRYNSKLDKSDISLFEERISKVVDKLSLLEKIKLQMLSSLSSEYYKEYLESASKVQFLTNKHTHLFPVETEEDKLLANKALSEIERDDQFLKHGDTQLLENIDLKEKDDQITITDETKVLEREPMYSKVLDVSDISELSSLADYLVGKLPVSQKKVDTNSQLTNKSDQSVYDNYVKEFMSDASHGKEDLYKETYGKNLNGDKIVNAVNKFYKEKLGLIQKQSKTVEPTLNEDIDLDGYDNYILSVLDSDSKLYNTPKVYMRNSREHVYSERKRHSYLQTNVDQRSPVEESVVDTHSINPMRVFNRHSRRNRNAKFRTRVGTEETSKLYFSY